ncbi:relaxase/mobilization nuclease domain-containing protein [Cloacibacterium sp.]|uniref:relaxase/mobilization nuclease domain-containing protein n=1 Tax=Cloacibacterium sp. TaxID=1913682 RepID=UPI0039E37DEB
MIVKIMDAAGSDFPGVNYNDKKIDKGKGELMLMKNFPSFIIEESNKKLVRDYLKSVSKNEKVRKPQFHAVISTKFQEHSKEELTKIAEDFMKEMGYGKQPYIVVYHKDTDNNHVHLVSTRVSKQTGKKINDSYEKLKAQRAMSNTMEKLYGLKEQEKLSNLLTYKISSLHQLETLLTKNGYKLKKSTNDENALDILKNGVLQRTLSGKQIVFHNNKGDGRSKQIRMILEKYKNIYSNKVFKVEDRRKQEGMLPEEKQKEDWKPKIEFESELQKKLKDTFGIDIVFHQAYEKHQTKEKLEGGLRPFGYTIIDHKTGSVYKGSDILKMNNLFEFTSETLDKKLFEILKDYNIANQETKKMLMELLKEHYPEAQIKDFMLFENKKLKNKKIYSAIRDDVKVYLKTQNKENISIIMGEDGKYYAIHSRLHYIGELKSMIGEQQYQEFLKPEMQEERSLGNELSKAIDEMLFELMKSSGTAKDPAENELKKRRKKRR